ncbi:hypothetical protein EVAR_95811_1 [Eumeta japonica]|uniref:Uncharacterized protein n=1 Tax=Eumeta variegata TaxID=151549 RepID=A0A4C1W3T8_EUMVA|nr:hypothetical protein EVAR_95811_1 [Eumeta japonica]
MSRRHRASCGHETIDFPARAATRVCGPLSLRTPNHRISLRRTASRDGVDSIKTNVGKTFLSISVEFIGASDRGVGPRSSTMARCALRAVNNLCHRSLLKSPLVRIDPGILSSESDALDHCAPPLEIDLFICK